MAKSKAENKTKSDAVLEAEKHEYQSQKDWRPLTSPEKLKEHQEMMAEKRKKDSKPPVAKPVYVQPQRRADGKYMKGCIAPNPSGRPLDGSRQLDHLLAAIRRVESKQNKNLLEHFVVRAFVSDKVLIAILKKICPDLQAISVTPGFNEEMTNEMALQIQQRLRERYGDPLIQEESETPPLLESATKNLS